MYPFGGVLNYVALFETIAFVAIFTTVMWYLILLGLDPHRRAKKSAKTLLRFLLWGFVSLIISFPVGYLHDYLLYYLSLKQAGYLPDLILEVLLTGQVEEFSKFLIFVILARTSTAIKEPLDGVTHAAAVGIGFAVMENILYFFYTFEVGVQTSRAFLTVPGHALYCALWGLYWISQHDKRIPNLLPGGRAGIVLALIPSAFLHGLYNWMVFRDLLGLSLLLDITVLIFVLYLYRKLRASSPYKTQRIKGATEAKSALESLKRQPDSHHLSRSLAEYCIRERRFNQAKVLLEHCLELEPKDINSQALLGCVLIHLNQISDGRVILNNATRKMTYLLRWRTKRDMRDLFNIGRRPALDVDRRYKEGLQLTYFGRKP